MLRKEWKIILSLVGLAVGLRVAWALAVHSIAMSDFEFYYYRGIDLAAGLGYQIGGHPTAYWPPGYPLLLAGAFKLIGPGLGTAKLMNMILWAGITVLIYAAGYKLGGRPVAIIAALAAALLPELIILPSLIASENLMILLVLATVVLVMYSGPIIKWTMPRCLALGLLMGYSALVRPTYLLLIAAAPLLYLLRYRSRQALKVVGVIAAGAALVISPWLIRNVAVMGAPVFSTNGGISLWWGNNPKATGGYELKGEYPDINSWQASSKAEIEEDRAFREKAMTYLARNPETLITMAPAKLEALFDAQPMVYWSSVRYEYRNGMRWKVFRELDPTETDLINRGNDYTENYNIPIQNTYWIIGLIGLTVALVMRAPGSAWLALLIGYWLAFHITLGNGQPRYLLAVAPLVLVAGSYLVVTLFRLVLSLTRRRRTVIATG